MKRLIAILLLASALLCSCKTQGGNAVTETKPVNGVQYEYAEDGSDRKSAAVIYENGVEVSRDNYVYNEDGSVASVTTIQNGKTVQELNYKYKDGKMILSTKSFVDNGINCKEVSEHNEKGHIAKTTYYEDNVKTGCERFTYDKYNNMIKSESIDDEENVITYTEYTYNSQLMIERADYYEFGSLALYYIYEYDAEGNLSGEKTYSPDGTLIKG